MTLLIVQILNYDMKYILFISFEIEMILFLYFVTKGVFFNRKLKRGNMWLEMLQKDQVVAANREL